MNNNVTIALHVLYAKKEENYPAYISKHKSNREKQVIILMIPNGEERERSKTLPSEALSTRAKSERQRRWH